MFKKMALLAGGVLLAGAVQAQKTGVQVGLKTGLSMAVLDGTINKGSDYKPGFHLGGFLRWRPVRQFALQPELVYSQQGSKNQVFVGSGLTLENKTKLSYLNVPILAKVYLGKVFFLQAGPQFGLLLSGHEVGQTSVTYSSSGTSYTTADIDVKKEYKSDVAVCAGLGADLPMGLSLAARLNYGFTDIDNNAQTQQIRKFLGIDGMHNRVIEVSVGYAFGN